VSFILDALRKSEHSRQRSTGPGLAEIPVVATRPQTNVWAWAAVALLVVNLVAVGVLLLKRGAREDAATSAVSAPAPATPTPPSTPPATTSTANPTLSSPPVAAPADDAPRPPLPTGSNPLAAEVGDAAGLDPRMAAAAAEPPSGPPAVTSRNTGVAPTKRGSVVYAPIPEAADVPYAAPMPAATPPTRGENLPGADEIAARGGLPALHLDLHVYATQATQRFVFVNSRKYREGDTLAEGPVVEKITPDGAVLDYRGTRFKLTND
jgi:general secretion pathway protein B